MRPKTKAIGLRVTTEQIEELNKVADEIGVDTSFLIRTAIDGLLNYVEANDGKITLPMDFTKAFTDIAELIDMLEIKNQDK